MAFDVIADTVVTKTDSPLAISWVNTGKFLDLVGAFTTEGRQISPVELLVLQGLGLTAYFHCSFLAIFLTKPVAPTRLASLRMIKSVMRDRGVDDIPMNKTLPLLRCITVTLVTTIELASGINE